MEWTGVNELRERFHKFFESKGHTRMPSAPLVPQGDSSLLLINSGMAPLKNYFLGLETPPSKRVTTCQKCIRTPDIEQVGKTARHGTYFEMLGNFSFGDYFKKEAIAWAWEFITEDLKLPQDKLWVSIYLDDDEAFDIWTKEIGFPADRIVRLGKEDNFWEIGVGPCGPCSEIHFDRGEEYGCGSPDCGVGCECDRYVEFWNLVFSQFISDGEGNYTEMESKNIDTGMGLERIACIMQGVDNIFEVDTMQKIMGHISKISGVKYGENADRDVSLRVVTDHIRSTVFMVSDGVVPQNEGRGYVLRRLLRRAARHGRLLGIDRAFLFEVCDTVIDENIGAYPELGEKRDYIKKVIESEEARFEKTIDQGMSMLRDIIDTIDARMIDKGEAILPGDKAFELYDTFGFPVDLVREIISEKNIRLDQKKFDELMQQQRERARSAREEAGTIAWEDDVTAELGINPTAFIGYTDLTGTGEVKALLCDGQLVDALGTGDKGIVILDKTPFYAESGGQVGDTGTMQTEGTILEVIGCSASPTSQFWHQVKVKEGAVQTGQSLTLQVDEDRRGAIARNHTAAHLLQAALREVLGDHVHQAGQLVDEHRVRFDFSHFSAMTQEELELVEEIVNREILKAIPTKSMEMSQQEAKDMGAMALFGEKYGDVVRVCQISDFSAELCGGTHVANTGNIGLFKIQSESSVAAGVRRIEAVTGENLLKTLKEEETVIAQVVKAMKLAGPGELVMRAAAMVGEIKQLHKEIESLNAKIAGGQLDSMIASAVEIGGVKLVSGVIEGADSGMLRMMAEQVRDRGENHVAVFAVAGDKSTVAVTAGKAAVQSGVHAGNLAREIAKLAGGNGGGRPDTAMAGMKDKDKVADAVGAAAKIVEEMLAKA